MLLRNPIIIAVLILSFSSRLNAAGAEDKPKKLIVLDIQGDRVDGKEFLSTLDAYMSEVGVKSELTSISQPPALHEGWVDLAVQVGKTQNALAILWFEPAGKLQPTYNIYLVLLEQKSGAVMVMPVELGMRQGPTMFRVLAATTRMVIDTELLDDIQEVFKMSQNDPTPDPWPAPKKNKISVDLSLSYIGDLKLDGPTVLGGGRIGIIVCLVPWMGLGFDAGYLGGKTDSVENLEFKEQRLPIRFAMAGMHKFGPTQGMLMAFWAMEPIWLSTELVTDKRDDMGNMARLNAGWGLELRWRFDVFRRFGLFVSVNTQFMVVSHKYERNDKIIIHPSLFKLGWSAGIDFADIAGGK